MSLNRRRQFSPHSSVLYSSAPYSSEPSSSANSPTRPTIPHCTSHEEIPGPHPPLPLDLKSFLFYYVGPLPTSLAPFVAECAAFYIQIRAYRDRPSQRTQLTHTLHTTLKRMWKIVSQLLPNCTRLEGLGENRAVLEEWEEDLRFGLTKGKVEGREWRVEDMWICQGGILELERWCVLDEFWREQWELCWGDGKAEGRGVEEGRSTGKGKGRVMDGGGEEKLVLTETRWVVCQTDRLPDGVREPST